MIGSVDAADVNEVSAYLSELVAANDLPEKLLVVHQFTPDMIADKETARGAPRRRDGPERRRLRRPPEQGGEVRRAPAARRHRQFHSGFKLFYVEDYPLMSAKQVEALKPPPEFIVYE